MYEQIIEIAKKMHDMESSIQLLQHQENKSEDNKEELLLEVNNRLHIVEKFLIKNARGFKNVKDKALE